jgi:DNA mismatch endonuclease, patch repair protein
MADRLSSEKRSWNMSRIRAKDTKPELTVRSILHRMGFRFRLNRKDLPGTPDIVFPKYRTALFVHGCYWHRHPRCNNATTPTKNADFWKQKFTENVSRDHRNQTALKEMGWIVGVIWECQIRKDPVLAVTNALIDTGMLEEEAPYPNMSKEKIRSCVKERFRAGWRKK